MNIAVVPMQQFIREFLRPRIQSLQKQVKRFHGTCQVRICVRVGLQTKSRCKNCSRTIAIILSQILELSVRSKWCSPILMNLCWAVLPSDNVKQTFGVQGGPRVLKMLFQARRVLKCYTSLAGWLWELCYYCNIVCWHRTNTMHFLRQQFLELNGGWTSVCFSVVLWFRVLWPESYVQSGQVSADVILATTTPNTQTNRKNIIGSIFTRCNVS